MSKLARRLWKWTAALVAAVLILLAVGVGLFRMAVPMVPELRADAEAMAEQALGWPVRIGAIDLQWALLGPELVLTDVRLLAPQTHAALVSAAQVDIVFSPLDIFQEGVPRPSHVRLHRPTLAFERDADGRLYLSGYALPEAGETRLDWRQALDTLLRHGRVTVLDGVLHYRDAARDIPGWTLRLAEVSLASDGENHDFEGNLLPPGALGEQVMFRFEAEGAAAQPETWQWSLLLGARELRPDGWYQQFPWAGPGHLQGTLNFTAQLRGKGLESLTGEGNFAAAALDFAATGANVPDAAPFERIAFDWRLEYAADNVLALAVDTLDIERAEQQAVGEKLKFRSSVAPSGDSDTDENPAEKYPLTIAAARLPLADVAALARFLPRDGEWGDLQTRIERLAPRGEVRDLSLELAPDADPPRFQVEATFEALGFAPQGDVPGARNLSGSIQGDAATGRLHLDSTAAAFDFGALFRTPLPAQKLAGDIRWQARDDGWRIGSEEVVVENPEAQARARFTLDIPADGPAVIDMTATAANVDFGARSTWLPVGIMSDALVHWLDTAIVAGHTPEARLVLRGPLENFPFGDGSGVFDVRFRTVDTAVAYAPGWPRVTGLNADVHFHGNALDIAIDRARVLDALAVGDSQARFADLGEGLLEVTAQVGGDVADGWRFLGASPLRENLAGLLDSLAVAGPMQAGVTLAIPLDDTAATQLTVTAQLQDVNAHPVALPWTVEDLSGALTITERDIVAERLTGRFHGHPFTASIAPLATPDEDFAVTRVSMAGRTDVADLHDYLPAAWHAHLDGAFDWTGGLRVPAADDGGVALDFASDLAGVSSTLPAPLDVLSPTQLEILMPDEAEQLDAVFRMRDAGSGHWRFANMPAGWTFERGRVALGPEAPAAPPLPNAPGLWLEGQVPVLDAAWLAMGKAADDAQAIRVQGFDILADRLLLGDRRELAGQTLQGTRREDGWDLMLAGPATGEITVPLAQDWPWRVRLERLHLPARPETAAQEATDIPEKIPDPRGLPGVILDIGDFRLGELRFGHVSGELRRTAIGYRTENLVARGPDFELALTGRWEYVQNAHYTSLSGDLHSSDLGDTAARLELGGAIDADEARSTVNLAWHGAPWQPDPALLEGTVSLEFKDGALLDVSPGAGRLLGLLSITALPRRLMLDFSDLFSEGLSFDTLSGDFLVTGGSAYTTNLRLDGAAVSALLVGRTGLAGRDYDQLAIVDPGVSASIPIAGYLAGGPTVGAALLVLSQLLEAPLSDITQVKYRITGSWDDPVIDRVEQNADASKTPTD